LHLVGYILEYESVKIIHCLYRWLWDQKKWTILEEKWGIWEWWIEVTLYIRMTGIWPSFTGTHCVFTFQKQKYLWMIVPALFDPNIYSL
jgi:hypothetical protein